MKDKLTVSFAEDAEKISLGHLPGRSSLSLNVSLSERNFRDSYPCQNHYTIAFCFFATSAKCQFFGL